MIREKIGTKMSDLAQYGRISLPYYLIALYSTVCHLLFK